MRRMNHVTIAVATIGLGEFLATLNHPAMWIGVAMTLTACTWSAGYMAGWKKANIVHEIGTLQLLIPHIERGLREMDVTRIPERMVEEMRTDVMKMHARLRELDGE